MNNSLDPDYVDSYYAATAQLGEPGPALRGDARADIGIVGGGIAGCSAALALAERGYEVTLLEAQRVGWGASGRSGGQAIFGLAADQHELERWIGKQDARRIWDITLSALAGMQERIARHHIECDWVSGEMFTAIKPRQWRALQRWHEDLIGDYDYRGTRLIEPAELSQLLATRRYIGALYDGACGHLHPLRYTLGLARAAREAWKRPEAKCGYALRRAHSSAPTYCWRATPGSVPWSRCCSAS